MKIDNFDEEIADHLVRANFDCYEYDDLEDISKLRFDTYEIVRSTEKGAWISIYPNERINYGSVKDIEKRFILLTANKQFASKTKRKAMQCLERRRSFQVKILKEQLSRAMAEHNAITKLLKKF